MIIPNSNMITCDASLRVKLGSDIKSCQRAKVEPKSTCLPNLWAGITPSHLDAQTGADILDVIRVLGHNWRLGLRPDNKLGDDTK